ncbi:MAG TPA: TadE family type IV pilus minor pilin [Micromonosporaceae bacterium]
MRRCRPAAGAGDRTRRSGRPVDGCVGFADRGSYTAELAAGLPALVLLLMVGLAAVGAVTTKAQCVDAAREAALAASRGESGSSTAAGSAPPGAEISVAVSGDTVVASVRAPVRAFGAALPRLTVAASAVAAVEPGTPAPAR